MKCNKPYNILSLFSGCGGMDLGFEGGFVALKKSTPEHFISKKINSRFVALKPTPFKVVFANDILNEAYHTWVYNFSKFGYNPDIYYKNSIVEIVKRHKDGEFNFPDNIDIVTGGFPCQDFSVAGKRRGFNSHKNHKGELFEQDAMVSDESRGKLYMWMKEVVEITKPKIFIAENVKGLVNLDDIKNIIQKDFASADGDGYIVLPPRVLKSADYGVSQSRERVIFIGIRKSALNATALRELSKDDISAQYDPYPAATHAYSDDDPSLLAPVLLKDILPLLDEPDVTTDPSQRYYSKAKFMGQHCQGQREISLNSISPTIRSEHHGNIEFRRLSTANGGKIDSELKKGLAERRLTLRECGMIQSFPPDFELVIPRVSAPNKFIVSPSAAYKVVGNAVPPLLAYNIAKRLEALWDLYFD